MSKKVYIFRGGPASGKGTAVPAFCELLPKPMALISQDNMRWNIHLIGRDISEVTDSEHKFANENTKVLFDQYLKNGNYTIVIEGLFTWDDRESSLGNALELIELAKKYGFETKSIVLSADKATLLERNAKREYSVPNEEFEKLCNIIYSTIDKDEIVIDSTGKSVQETVDLIASQI